MSAENAVKITELSFAYDQTPALAGVNLEIKKNDFACIVGPNGGGKSTLLKLILGILKPDTGTVSVLGNSPQKARSKIGYLPQYFRVDPAFPATVFDVVLTGTLATASWLGPYRKKNRQAVLRALKNLAIADLKSRQISELSGGQLQRVMIARALAGDPEVLLFDEPTASLDVKAGQQFNQLLADLNNHRTVIVVSHDLDFASEHLKNVICVDRQVRIHPTAELTAENIRHMLGTGLRLVQHEHDCIEKGCLGKEHKC